MFLAAAQVFTPGPFSLELSARMYGATWRFEQQGLPKDLESRCVHQPLPAQCGTQRADMRAVHDMQGRLLAWMAGLSMHFAASHATTESMQLASCRPGSLG